MLWVDLSRSVVHTTSSMIRRKPRVFKPRLEISAFVVFVSFFRSDSDNNDPALDSVRSTC